MKKLSPIFLLFCLETLCSCKLQEVQSEYSLKWVSGVDALSESPVSLTASDGTGLKMVSFIVKGLFPGKDC